MPPCDSHQFIGPAGLVFEQFAETRRVQPVLSEHRQGLMEAPERFDEVFLSGGGVLQVARLVHAVRPLLQERLDAFAQIQD